MAVLWIPGVVSLGGAAAAYWFVAHARGETGTEGLLLSFIGVVVWLLWPPRADSRWKLQGPFGSGGKTVAELRAEQQAVREQEG